MTAITVQRLHKTYGAETAIDGIDLAIEAGEVFAILGPNGAGKSTTLEILEGHRHRDSGDVRVLGEDPATAGRDWRARVGIVLQGASDAADLSAVETLRHFARYYPRARRPEQLLEQVGLADQAGRRVRSLSGGQRRRLDVALGIIGRPEVVFLDEPTTGFDPEARRDFWQVIRGLAGEGTTIVLTTHYLDEAEALADRLVVMSRGSVVVEGTPATLGGREHAQAVVTWTDDLGTHTRRTPDPSAVVAELTAAGTCLGELSVSRPSLEDTYLALIGDLR